jgi:hypothetical protein
VEQHETAPQLSGLSGRVRMFLARPRWRPVAELGSTDPIFSLMSCIQRLLGVVPSSLSRGFYAVNKYAVQKIATESVTADDPKPYS